MKIDVIIATQDRLRLLARCLESLCTARLPYQISLVIYISISGGDAELRAWLYEFARRNCSLKLRICECGERLLPPAARNRLLAMVEGDWLFFIDDDAFIDEDFFFHFVRAVEENPIASALGGPNLTPHGSSLFQRATGAALSSIFGAGISSVRYMPARNSINHCGEERLILCNLFVKRAVLGQLRFSERLLSNEENWLLQNLIRDGRALVYVPSLHVWHERRQGVLAFLAQIYRYGTGRGQNLRGRPETVRAFHVLPTLCLLFTLTAWLVFPWSGVLVSVWFTFLGIYLVGMALAMLHLKFAAPQPASVSFLGGLLFPLIHVTYGAGLLRGLSVAP